MCLYPKQNLPTKATSPIQCWKILLCNEFGDLFTPYQGVRLSKNVIDGTKPFVAVGVDETSQKGTITCGYIHSYTDLEMAKRDARFLSVNKSIVDHRCVVYIFQCVVSAGVEYFESLYGSECASKEIVFLKTVKPIVYDRSYLSASTFFDKWNNN